MSKFHTLRVREVRSETADCVSVAFDVPDELTEHFTYLQGQYLTLKTNIKGEEVRRSYSICSSPLDKELRVAIKKVPEGRFSTFANEELKEGMELDVMSPMGRFYTTLNPDNKKHYLAFVAGSGITPVMSILKTVLHTEPESRFTLFFGNKNSESVIFREQLDALKSQFMNRLAVHHVLSREHPGSDLFYGRIEADRVKRFLDVLVDAEEVDEFFICGPEPMIHAVSDELKARHIDSKKIHFELFTSSASLAEQKKRQQERLKNTAAFDVQVRLQLDGHTMEFPMSSNEQSILDAALAAGADLPYACKGGVCCTCRAKLLKGEAEMMVNYALEPEEVEAGFILTCQAFPKSEAIEVDFDS